VCIAWPGHLAPGSSFLVLCGGPQTSALQMLHTFFSFTKGCLSLFSFDALGEGGSGSTWPGIGGTSLGPSSLGFKIFIIYLFIVVRGNKPRPCSPWKYSGGGGGKGVKGYLGRLSSQSGEAAAPMASAHGLGATGLAMPILARQTFSGHISWLVSLYAAQVSHKEMAMGR
jgi:hypothetical protein